MNDIETKLIGGRICESKANERDGVPVGIIKGYIATWDTDRCNDQFQKGCFSDSLDDHRKKGRQIRLKDQHGRTVGGFPIASVKEDDVGLYGEGEVNLNVQQGKELFELVRQGVLCDFSIGFTPVDYKYEVDVNESGNVNKRVITKAVVWEGSIVDEPMNPAAKVTEFKSVVPFQDLPLADRSVPWDAGHAIARVKSFTGSEEEPSPDFKKAFLWYDVNTADQFGSYKLPIADVIDNRLMVVPRAIFAAAAALRGARSGLNLPSTEKQRIISNVERYYEKLGLESPWSEKGFRLDDLHAVDERTLEDVLKKGVCFSSHNAKVLVSCIKSASVCDGSGANDSRDGSMNEAELVSIGDALDGVLNMINS
jgi:HK97 family phage prohead protease